MSFSILNLDVNWCHTSQAAETQGESRTTPLPDFPRASRAPLRDISPLPPTLHDDDIDMEPRRKRPTSNSLVDSTPSNPRSIKSLPNRLRKSGEISEMDKKPEAESIPPGPGQRVQNPPTREKRASFDFDLLTEVDDTENAPPRPSKHKGKGRAMDQHSTQKRHLPDGYSSDYGIDEENMFEDDGFWEVLDRVEKEALEDGERSNTQSKSKVDSDGDSYSKRRSTALPTPVASANDVIELDDDSDEDANKENAFVPMRHVRRKTEELVRGRSPTSHKRQSSSQKKKKADVIDISDSD